MKLGHSNVHSLHKIKPYPTNPDRFSIPIQGGATVTSVKDLPPLALSEQEWREIGSRAGWLKEEKQ